jgi:hypothetical protein
MVVDDIGVGQAGPGTFIDGGAETSERPVMRIRGDFAVHESAYAFRGKAKLQLEA